jgi:transcriptional regulator with XRE-family HTH domain
MADSIHNKAYKGLISALASARKEAGMTQQVLADRVGKPQSFIAKIEGFERRLDIIEFLILANAIGIDPTPLIAEAKQNLTG